MGSLLVNVYRNQLVESRHYGDVVVVDKYGKTIFTAGDENKVTYWRSAAKPLLALPVVFSGAAGKFGLTDKELAVMAASHNGEEQHINVVRSILNKIGMDETALLCGTHLPYYKPDAHQLIKKGEEPGPIYNNCSGKHAGLLSICRYYNWSVDDYLQPGHPVQELLLGVVSDITDYSQRDIFKGEDGCGVIVYGLPIKYMAYAYTRLANPQLLTIKYQKAAVRISRSMEKYPEIVAGSGRFNTDLLKVTGNRLMAKIGAEGVFCIGIHGGPGIALKIGDGNKRAIPPVVIETLVQLDVLTDKQLEQLSDYYSPIIKNSLKHEVGKIVSDFKLEKIDSGS